MKKALLILLLCSSCSILKDRAVDKAKEKIRLIDKTVISEKAPGDNVTILLPAPLSSPQRPKATIKTYNGEKGAKLSVQFDTTGLVNRIDSDCPEIDKIEQKNIELDYALKTKEVESKANIELANTIGKWSAITLIPIGALFALAFYFKG